MSDINIKEPLYAEVEKRYCPNRARAMKSDF